MRLRCERRRYDSDGILRDIKFETHEAKLVYHASNLNDWWIELKPGVTGYESVSVADLLEQPFDQPKGWFANAGTPGSYDELYVLPEEVDRLRDFLRLVQPLLAKGGPQ